MRYTTCFPHLLIALTCCSLTLLLIYWCARLVDADISAYSIFCRTFNLFAGSSMQFYHNTMLDL